MGPYRTPDPPSSKKKWPGIINLLKQFEPKVEFCKNNKIKIFFGNDLYIWIRMHELPDQGIWWVMLYHNEDCISDPLSVKENDQIIELATSILANHKPTKTQAQLLQERLEYLVK